MEETQGSNHKLDRGRRGQLVAGVILVLLGAALLLTEAGWLSGIGLYRLWPLIVIAVGATRVMSGDRDDRKGGYIVLFMGCWMLANTLNLFGLYWGNSWPLPMVAVGLALILGGHGRERTTGLVMIGVGAIFLSATTDLLGLGLRETWPLALILVGLWIAIGAFGGAGRGTRREEASRERS